MSNATFTAYIASLKREDQTIWKPIKSRKKPRTPLPTISTNTRPTGPWAKSDTEKANLFANHVAEVYKPHDDTPDPEILRKLAIHDQQTEKPRAFTIGELKGVIKRLQPRKAPGPDLVTTLMIQELPPEGLKAILHLLNAIIRLERWPKPLKQAKVVMILKPGKNPTDVTSYRPISLLPVITKILEKLLLLRLSNHMPPQSWIPSHQFGFRNKHCTIHQCHRLTDSILKAFEDQKYCSAVFLDISQAFDKVWHTGLLLKIQQMLPQRYFTLLRSYLIHRYLVVSYNNVNLSPVMMHSGVPQGSILGPFL
jgi:hypothetical protein